MHLVQLLLPLFGDDGIRIAPETFAGVRDALTQQFGGVTAYMRAPAIGLWKTDSGEVDRDEVVIVEVMVEALDRAWWRAYRDAVTRTFRQDTLVVRAIAVEMIQ